MVNGWRGWLKKWLEGAAQSLDRRPVKKWTQEQQRLGGAVTIAAIATFVICLFGFMIFDSHIEKSQDVTAVVGPPQSLLAQEKWPCKRSEDNRASDLCAQWKAADAARKAADWSVTAFIFGTGINSLTVLAVFFGWMETKKATAAAIDSARHARSVLEAERAWMTPAKPEIRLSVTYDPTGAIAAASCRVKLTWINSGRSPALSVRQTSDRSFIVNGGAPPKFKFPNGKHGLAIGAGIIFDKTIEITNLANIQDLLARTHRLIIYTSVKYTDIYQPNIERESAICVAINAKTTPGKPGETVIIPVGFTPIGPQNFTT